MSVGQVSHSPVASTSTTTKINNILSELMHAMCRGIERIFSKTGNKVPDLSSRPVFIGDKDAQVPGYHLKALK